MELKLYDTLTREKRVFTPLDPANVRMYVCGPTVYDFAHIGNARPVIVFDVLFRLLRHLYGPDHVTYVRNITDVDDKIKRAPPNASPSAEAGGDLNAEIRRLTEETYANFKADVAALGCLPPTVEPRATEHIDEMKALIERLVAAGHAYVAEDHVLFAVASMPDYGRLSKRPLDEMIAGARVEVAPYKRDAMDFVLWKPSKPGEPAWPSPCGIAAPGRPGWHIECSAMSDHWLWTKAEPRLSPAGLAHPHQFDIHGGGVDLVFPHHENEIAQSRCAFHTPVMANYWMHNGFLMVEGEKMAKSLGNFITIRELLDAWPGDEIRLAMLQTHYRQPINWTAAGLREAKRTLDHWYALTADTAPGFSALTCSMRSLTTSTRRKRLPLFTSCELRPRKEPKGRQPVSRQALRRSACSNIPQPDGQLGGRSLWRSMKSVSPASLRHAMLHARARTSRRPTASAMNLPLWASCSRTARTARPGRSRDDFGVRAQSLSPRGRGWRASR